MSFDIIDKNLLGICGSHEKFIVISIAKMSGVIQVGGKQASNFPCPVVQLLQLVVNGDGKQELLCWVQFNQLILFRNCAVLA